MTCMSTVHCRGVEMPGEFTHWQRIACLVLHEYWSRIIDSTKTWDDYKSLVEGASKDYGVFGEVLLRAIGGEWEVNRSYGFHWSAYGPDRYVPTETWQTCNLRACAEKLIPDCYEYAIQESMGCEPILYCTGHSASVPVEESAGLLSWAQ